MGNGKSKFVRLPTGQAGAATQCAARSSIRKQLCDGLEAALRANPEMLANSQPRTVLGLIVRALVFEAGNGRMTALRIILQLLDRDREEAATAVTERISGETQCDWSADGAWRIRPDTKAMEAEPDGPPNSLSQGISQGISEKVAPGIKAAEQPRPMNREQRRRLAARARQRQKEEARSREFAEAA